MSSLFMLGILKFCNLYLLQIYMSDISSFPKCNQQINFYMRTQRNKQLSKLTFYDHGSGILKANNRTRSIERQTLSSFRVRAMSTMAHEFPSQKKCDKKYNKWYVEPTKQFIQQTKNPKNSKKILSDEQYIYKNLRNQEFWEWSHPFQKKLRLKQPYCQAFETDKLDPKILKKFKKHITDSGSNKRIPSAVQHFLNMQK